MTPEVPKPHEAFGFNEQEALFNRVTDTRFQELITDPRTTVHKIELSNNNYGEFLFVTVSKPGHEKRECVTFYGMGYHDYRERWLTDHWYWYRSTLYPETLEESIGREETEERLRERRDEIRPYVTDEPPSEQGRLFADLADLTDEDNAMTELADLEDLMDSSDF